MTTIPANHTRELLPGVEAATAQRLEDAIRNFISKRELALYRMMSFQLGWVDEHGEQSTIPTRPRVHGQFALAVASVINSGDLNAVARVVPYVVSIELLQNYSLIHEDVEDGNTEHNGRPSVWWTWGPAQAINAGDGMHAMARMALFALSEKGEPVETVSSSLKALDEAAVQMCEGEYLDITMQEQIALSTQGYLDMVQARSGALFGAAARIAAIASGRHELAPGLAKFGALAGTARQLSADYLLFWGDGNRDSVQQGRLLTKKKNLPVVHAIETAPTTVKRQLGDIYVQRVIDPAKVSDLVALLEDSGSDSFVLDLITQTLMDARQALADLDLDPDQQEELNSLASALAGFDEVVNPARSG